jgi:hypothetical protein
MIKSNQKTKLKSNRKTKKSNQKTKKSKDSSHSHSPRSPRSPSSPRPRSPLSLSPHSRSYENILRLKMFTVKKNTCILRAKRDRDDNDNDRFFVFYGNNDKIDITKYKNSKNFIKKYEVEKYEEPYQYYKFKKDIKLIKFPYSSIDNFQEDNDYILAIDLCFKIVNYILNVNNESVLKDFYDKAKTTKKMLLSCINETVLKNIALDDLDNKYKGLVGKYEKCIEVFKENDTNIGKYNPDYMIANFLCYLGYNGWVRQSSFKKDYYCAADEIYICNINKKFLKETISCKLSEDKLDKDGLFVDLYGNLVDSHGNLV